MSECFLKMGRIDDAASNGGVASVGYNDTYVFDSAGNPKKMSADALSAYRLQSGEGELWVSGKLDVTPFEIELEFRKTGIARKWLENLIVRHVIRQHYLDGSLTVFVRTAEEGTGVLCADIPNTAAPPVSEWRKTYEL
jgi:hypothetical protein